MPLSHYLLTRLSTQRLLLRSHEGTDVLMKVSLGLAGSPGPTPYNKKLFYRSKCQSISCVCLFVTPWTKAHQGPLSMEFSRQEYWTGCPFSSPGDLPNPGIKPRSPLLQADSLWSEPTGNPPIESTHMHKKVFTLHSSNGATI